MGDINELRKQMHLAYLEKKQKQEEQDRLDEEARRVKAEQDKLLNQEEEQVEEVMEDQEQEEEEMVEEEEEEENELEQQQQFQQQQDYEEEIIDEEEEEEENELEQQMNNNAFNPFGNIPAHHFNQNNPFGGQGGIFPGHPHHQPPQSFGGTGYQLVDSSTVNPSLATGPIITGNVQQDRDAFVNSIENRFSEATNTSPPTTTSTSPTLNSRKREDYSIKKLVDLCLLKMSKDLNPYLGRLRLLSPDLVSRLLEIMISNKTISRTKIHQLVTAGVKFYDLNLSNQRHIINNNFLEESFKYMPEIQRVNFSNCGTITDNGMSIFKRFLDIRVLDLRDTKITDNGLKCIKNFLKLKELYLRNTSISDKGFLELSFLTDIDTLDISYCTGITDSSIDVVATFTKMKYLYLGGTSITDKGIQTLSKSLTNVVFISLANCHYLTNQSLFSITYMKDTLKDLDINQTKINGMGFVHLRNLSKLNSIVLPGRDSLDSKSIQYINNLVNIRKLDLTDYNKIDDISSLTSLRNLVELSLSNTKVSDSSMSTICNSMKSLKHLQLGRTLVSNVGVSLLQDLSLKSLSLKSTQIDDQALMYLSNIKSLQTLDLSNNTLITDLNMEYLSKSLNNLISLDLRGTNAYASSKYFKDNVVRPPVKDVPRPPRNHNHGWGGGDIDDGEFDEGGDEEDQDL